MIPGSPFDQLTFEQAAAYIDAEIRFVDAEWRVSWWTSELDDFDQACPCNFSKTDATASCGNTLRQVGIETACSAIAHH